MWVLLGSLLTVVFLITPKINAEIVDCDFFDTVDLSAARRLWNGAYLYEGLHIPAHLTGEYNFKILPDGSKEKVATHIRGCACKLRPCARVCCPRNNQIQNTVCYMDLENFDWLDPYLKVTLSNGTLVQRQTKTDIVVQWDLPLQCDYTIYLNSKEESDQYTLFENGTFVQDHKYKMTLNRPQYCLQHLQFRDKNTKYISKKPEPLICLILISKTWNNAGKQRCLKMSMSD